MPTIEKKLIDLYFANLDLIEEGLPAAFNAHRREAIQSFHLTGLPTRRVEKYKYTDIRFRYEGDFEQFFTPVGRWNGQWQPLVEEAFVIRLLNGYAAGDEVLTVLENGIIFGSLRAAATACPELISNYYNRLTDSESDPIASLNTAFVQDGAFIYLPPKAIAEKPFVVLCGQDAPEDAQIYTRTLVVAEENSEAKVILQSCPSDNCVFLENRLSEWFVGEGARIESVEVQAANERSTLLTSHFVDQRAASRYLSLALTAGGSVIRNNTSVYLNGRGAESHLYGLFLAGEGEQADVYTNIDHRVADCVSYEDFRGVASADGRGSFNGRIRVAPDAQRTQAFQQNHNLLLSDGAVIHTKPQLEIYADDVKCSHGATVGRLDPQAVFYMRQRGIGEAEARRLQLYGFARRLIDHLSLAPVAEVLDRLVAEKIEQL
ncbi:MAG: Fe-S cluster assembly protein SufD [Rikenellaceae bacterium]|jgi:Fe-S cluster assembly protein SufD|nr:Fe-S cluster assembly protein SufD [Rikenellaceae bacterium]